MFLYVRSTSKYDRYDWKRVFQVIEITYTGGWFRPVKEHRTVIKEFTSEIAAVEFCERKTGHKYYS